jgi:hypothetical protein
VRPSDVAAGLTSMLVGKLFSPPIHHFFPYPLFPVTFHPLPLQTAHQNYSLSTSSPSIHIKFIHHLNFIANDVLLKLSSAQLSGLTFDLALTGAIFVNLASSNLYTLPTNVPRDEISALISGTSGMPFTSLTPGRQEKVK